MEKIRKEAIQHCGSDADCIRDYMEKRVGADIAGLLFPHLSSQSGKFGKFFGIDPWFEFSSFVMDHPTFSLAVVSTIIALFVSPPLGGTMLVSGAISGGVSWLQGNDPDTILRDAGIGGFAGVFGYGVFAGVTRYVGARLAQSTLSPFLQKWLPKIIGGGSGGVADQSAFDGLRDRKFDWRSATIAGMIGILIPYAGAVLDGSPALGKQLQQMIPGVSGDGTLAMPWVKKNGQEAAEGYNKASGKSGGTLSESLKIGNAELEKLPVRGNQYRIKGTEVVIKGRRIVKVNDISKYRKESGLSTLSDEEALKQVAKIRNELGIPALGDDLKLKSEKILNSEQTVAVLESDGYQIWGRNGWGTDQGGYKAVREEWLKSGGKRNPSATNAQTVYHAEGDAFWNLYKFRKQNNILGGKATMVVDRDFCRSCGDGRGVQQMVEEVGLDELIVITPSGRQSIKPRPELKRTSW
ncbi:hypothetical protein ACFQ49_09910 [Kroppenstedtia eburnea]|uniref:hypothetical protein n=1 Tax=Kroppenstedtia eburnea TaxID=714067 RepID=UPI0036251101